MNTPYFSVIVVSRNAGDKLKETVESILCQTCQDLEVIIKDAGSTDGSLETIPQDPRIRLICRKDAGIYDGMNEALSCAQGELIYFLNCGDVLHDSRVLAGVRDAALSFAGSSAIFYGDVIEERTGQRVAANPQMSHFAMYRYLPCHQACFYTRDLFAKRQFDTKYLVRADYEHFLYCVMPSRTTRAAAFRRRSGGERSPTGSTGSSRSSTLREGSGPCTGPIWWSPCSRSGRSSPRESTPPRSMMR